MRFALAAFDSFVLMLAYVLTLASLAGFSAKSKAPAALGDNL